MSTTLYNLSPLWRMALLITALGAVPMCWVLWCHRAATARVKLHRLTLLVLFLTFDLVLFGAFTRLTDSGLGCPDWPGCYGHASPLGAQLLIQSAQTALPSGPVTLSKAWIEMAHRYAASVVGFLILVLALASLWAAYKRSVDGAALRASVGTLMWVLMQGALGALTVTWKLYPAIVTLHLLGGMGLLVLLTRQAQCYQPRALPLPTVHRQAMWILALLVGMQIALGAWVSTNYAVLACTDFPQCQGAWWPVMDFENGFTLWRELGQRADGAGYLPFAALTAIHFTHRLMAWVVLLGMVIVGWQLLRLDNAAIKRRGVMILGLAAWQLASGLGNVVLGWPLIAALAHTAGAAALVVVLADALLGGQTDAAIG
jgi:heme a synthase